MLKAPPICCLAITILYGVVLPECHAGYPPIQKGGVKQKGAHVECGRCEHVHHCVHPPHAPLIQSVGVMQVALPERRVRVRVEEEAGQEPESGTEEDVKSIEQRLDILEAKFESLFHSVNALVQQLQPKQ